jgi:hypothetical protein
MSKRKASVSLKTRVGDKEYTYENAGGVIASDYEGSYTIILSFDTDEKNEKGYPVQDRVLGLVTESGRKVRIIDDAGKPCAFLNVTVWEDMAQKPRD